MNALLMALSVVFAWDAVTTDIAGNLTQIDHYTVYKQSLTSTRRYKVIQRKGTSGTASISTAGKWNYCVTATDVNGKESECSNKIVVETDICLKEAK